MTRSERRNPANTRSTVQNPAGSLEGKSVSSARSKQATHRVRLPGFMTDEEIGLGETIKRTASYFGMKPCGGCQHRTAYSTAGWFSFLARGSDSLTREVEKLKFLSARRFCRFFVVNTPTLREERDE